MQAFTRMGLKEAGLAFERLPEPGIARADETYAAGGFDGTVDVEVTVRVGLRLREDAARTTRL